MTEPEVPYERKSTPETDAIEVKCTPETIHLHTVKYNIEARWVSNAKCADGGYFRNVKCKPKNPSMFIRFKGTVDKKLSVGSVYFSGSCMYLAIDTHTIVNSSTHIYEFEIPTKLYKLYTPASEL